MEINEHLLKIINLMKAAEDLDLFPVAAQLSQTEFRLLREVILEQEKGGEIISSELARRLKITRSAISQIVKRMESNGIVKRVPAPVDKKIAYVHLSDNALALFEEQCAQANGFMEKVVKTFGEDKFGKMVKLFDEFVETFDGEYKKARKN